MKTAFTLLGILLAPFGFSQCIDFFQDTVSTCSGLPVTFDGVPSPVISNVQILADFNSGTLPTGWSTSAGTTFSQPCGTGIDNSPYFWASTSGMSTPYIQTNQFDFTAGGYVTFDFYYAIQGGTAPCEGPDLANEGMELQYSIDGGVSWFSIIYYSPGGYQLPQNPGSTASVASGVTPYTSWNSEIIQIPPGAQTPNTLLRWIQTVSSGTCCDNWGVDNINVYGTIPGTNYQWNTGTTTLEMTTSSTVDSIYTISVYDVNNMLVCQDSVNLLISSSPFDLGIQAIAQPFVQGQQAGLFVDAYNMGCPEQSGEIVVKLDPLTTFISSVPTPTLVTTDSITYNYSGLYENGPHFIIAMNVQVSQSAVIGDTIDVEAYITPITGDANPLDNVKDYNFPVVASYDPNDKKVYPLGDCDVGYVPNDQLMTYTIRFQNTGTSNAINVRVRDEIHPNLDPSSLRVVAASDNYFLDWVTPTTLDFKFDNIQLPPQSQGDFESIGYVVFEIEQIPGLTHGTPFTNQVDIYFDFNSPITTNEVVNTVTDGSHAPIGDTMYVDEISSYDWNGQTLTNSGIYTQLFPMPDGCDSTAILSLTIGSDVGLNLLTNNPFVIYPNPAKDHIIVAGNQEGLMRFMNLSGTILMEERISGNFTIQLDAISSGVYFVEIESNGRFYREKLIIKK